MQTSKAFLIALLAGAAAAPNFGQPASPERQAQALELLRQALSQQPAEGSMQVNPAPVTTPMNSAPASTPMNSAPVRSASPEQQEQAIQLLRGMTAQQLAAPPSPTTAPVQPKLKGNKPASNHVAAPSKVGGAQSGKECSSSPAQSDARSGPDTGPARSSGRAQDQATKVGRFAGAL